VETGTQSVRTAVRVVEEVGRHGPVGVSDLARRLALPKSTVQRALATLGEVGWLQRDAQSRWSVTLRCANVGRGVVHERAMREAGRPVLEALRDATGETSRWFLIEGSEFALVDTAESVHAVRPVESELPGPIPLHATAVGKAAMAGWTTAQLTAATEGPLAAMTDRTVTSRRTLRADLEQTRARGWGQVDGELYPDVGGVAAVAPIPGDRLVGIGVSYPLHRTTARDVRDYGALVVDAAPRLAETVAPLV
jgi:IclR family acetate operon transcriptional repressor